jgi:hypothetical protein
VLHALPLVDRRNSCCRHWWRLDRNSNWFSREIEFAFSEKIGAILLSQKFFQIKSFAATSENAAISFTANGFQI